MDSDDDAEAMEVDERTTKVEDAVAMVRGEGKTLRRKEKRARIDQIRASLGLSDLQRTPLPISDMIILIGQWPGESLKDFYKRTNIYWQMAAHEHTQHTGKELRKDGFDLAEVRYKELKPILDEVNSSWIFITLVPFVKVSCTRRRTEGGRGRSGDEFKKEREQEQSTEFT
ncbi:hypothetical protein QJS10_CPA16g00285 [Acorus calamus]|uniref:DUF4110 domain-containing protein n=1 Tax=Acorus calamus TaxID=4465 RepID=A0AAV9CY92_ACOCL|nr:hypothetical protein QJS10_CPA16g00285 [Acorus calamus]